MHLMTQIVRMLMPTANTDWLHELFGDSFTQEHSISVNGGTDVMQYYMSANYLDERRIIEIWG